MRGWPLPLFVRRLVDLIAAKLTRGALPILLGRAGVLLLLDHPPVAMDCPGRIRPHRRLSPGRAPVVPLPGGVKRPSADLRLRPSIELQHRDRGALAGELMLLDDRKLRPSQHDLLGVGNLVARQNRDVARERMQELGILGRQLDRFAAERIAAVAEAAASVTE